MGKFGKIAGVLLVVGLVLGYRVYKKQLYQKELRAELVSACAEDQACLAAVEANFNGCYESHYSMGTRHRSGGLKEDEFLDCFNRQAGKEVFAKRKKDGEPKQAE